MGHLTQLILKFLFCWDFSLVRHRYLFISSYAERFICRSVPKPSCHQFSNSIPPSPWPSNQTTSLPLSRYSSNLHLSASRHNWIDRDTAWVLCCRQSTSSLLSFRPPRVRLHCDRHLLLDAKSLSCRTITKPSLDAFSSWSANYRELLLSPHGWVERKTSM